MATAEKRVVTDATGQAIVTELRKIPGVMTPLPVEKGGTGVTTPDEIRELIGAQEKFDFDVREELNAAVKSVNEIKPDSHGNVQILRVPMADNFTSNEAQVSSGLFIERTTGGDTSITDGMATVGVLYGHSIRSGHTAETKSMEVHLAGRIDDSTPISADISWDTYKAAVNYISTNKTLTYTTSWSENPEIYGITVTGTPVNGDVINVYFIAENRGSIANATPESFVETNWNLYDNVKGYARVLKYSDEYGFKIGGTYTGVSFSATVDGEKTVLTPDSDGIFTVPSDGYVFVTGGNNTDTYILMTWSDWHNGYTGDFLAYAEDVIDISELMSNVFPYGMCSIGITMDEINFNDQTAIVRIERVAYTTENRILAEQSGRDFVYDADWIYSAKETPERVRFSIGNQVTVYDHGMEFFAGTDVSVLAYVLFGQNLKDKLRREVVAVTPQNFSAAQKAQARENIEAAWTSEVIKSINNKVPDANGNITIVEGQSNASYGSYRIDPVIPPAAWSLINGQYQVAYSDPLIKATMTGAETWLDDDDVMLGATHFNTIDGALIIVTEVLPTDTWRLHVLLAENGATVLEQVHNKAEESVVAIVESGDTAFHNIDAGQYVIWNGDIYKAISAISSGDTLAATGNGANLSVPVGGAVNDIMNILSGQIEDINNSSRKNVSVLTYAASLSEGIHFYTTAGNTEDNPEAGSHAFMIFRAVTGITIYGMSLGSRHAWLNASNNNGSSYSGWEQIVLNSDLEKVSYASVVTDFNSCTETGVYCGNSATNSPITGWVILSVTRLASNENWIVQVAHETNNNKYFVRSRDNGTWRDWQQLARNSEITALSEQTANIDTAKYREMFGSGTVNNCNDGEIGRFYFVYGSTTNAPKQGILYTYGKDNTKYQIFIAENTVYTRGYINSAWTAWQQLATRDTSIENLGTKTFGSAKEMINFFKQLANDSAYRNRTLSVYCYMSHSESLIFGTSSFAALATFTSSNYGNILCMSDNRASGGVKNICIVSNTAYIQTFTASETSLSLT